MLRKHIAEYAEMFYVHLKQTFLLDCSFRADQNLISPKPTVLDFYVWAGKLTQR